MCLTLVDGDGGVVLRSSSTSAPLVSSRSMPDVRQPDENQTEISSCSHFFCHSNQLHISFHWYHFSLRFSQHLISPFHAFISSLGNANGCSS